MLAQTILHQSPLIPLRRRVTLLHASRLCAKDVPASQLGAKQSKSKASALLGSVRTVLA